MALSTFAMPAFASAEGTGFVPSISQKQAPSIDEDTIVTSNGSQLELDELDKLGYKLVVTPGSDVDSAPNDVIRTDLVEAIKDIEDNDQDIVFADEDSEDKFLAALETAENNGNELVCSNIFDVSLIDKETKEKVAIDSVVAGSIDPSADPSLEVGSKIKLTMKVENANELVLVMHKPDDSWEVLKKGDFTDNGDGTITVTLDSLCPIAFFTEAAKAVNPDPGKDPVDPTPTDPSKPGGEGKNPFRPGHIDFGGSAKQDTVDLSKDNGGSSANNGGATAGGDNTAATPAAESPATGAGSGSVLLVSAILTTVAGAALVIKAKKE
jgi:hypothetical protein